MIQRCRWWRNTQLPKMGLRILELWKASAMMLETPKGWRRFYSSNSKAVDLKTLKPMIMEKIRNRANDYPVKATAVLAQETLNARGLLYRGVSDLLRHLPVWTCKYCPEVYVGESGHLIRTCGGYRRQAAKIKAHEWIKACLNDILVPVEAYHIHVQNTVHNVTKPQERFGQDRIPAIVELCLHAGANPSDQSAYMESRTGFELAEAPSDKEMKLVAIETLKAWEALRNGVQKLLVVFPVKVCKLCSEVHVGQHSGNKARICRIHESWHEAHLWKKAGVDDLVPAKRVWYQRPQDPPVLVDEGRNYYGHSPAVIDICVKAGAIAPSKYFSIMKADGLSSPI
ncbi:PREDICTED: APO protein 4, mitochondrial-like [Ipomoea nil]|uniref:APO protein 4, mitochondrial-like n=1 Tax=Ipomoea nil TaxID=35883 RepID=UPI0009011089|nr:PREDICTED: APO protein 4, mitochondrial-like [Ipomoea nil]